MKNPLLNLFLYFKHLPNLQLYLQKKQRQNKKIHFLIFFVFQASIKFTVVYTKGMKQKLLFNPFISCTPLVGDIPIYLRTAISQKQQE